MKREWNELIVMAEKDKKKGGSMASVFKLIQELLEFEEKIQECCNAQEMSENKRRIKSFMVEIDKMYDVLFEMARGGISNIRDQRSGVIASPENKEEESTEVGDDLEVDGDGEGMDLAPIADKRKTPVMLNVPQIPRM